MVGISDKLVFSLDPWTGFIPGEGGIPSVRRGGRELLWVRAPGKGGLSKGAGDDIFGACPDPGGPESLSSATLIKFPGGFRIQI
jgi:hypothetical protein